MRYSAPGLNSIGLLALVVLLERATGRRVQAYLVLLVVGLTPPLLVFTSGATKETYAHVLFYTLLVMLVIKPSLLATSILGMGLILYHHLTAFIYIIILIVYALSVKIRYILIGVEETGNTYRHLWLNILIVMVIALIYYPLVGFKGFKYGVKLYYFIELTMYFIGLAPVLLLALAQRHNLLNKTNVLLTLVAQSIVLTILIVSSATSVAPGIPPLGLDIVFYGLPACFVPMVVYVSLDNVVRYHRTYCLIISWLFSTTVLMLYALVSGNPIGPSAIHRICNFFLMGIGIAYIFSIVGKHRLAKLLLIFLILHLILPPVIIYRIVNDLDNVSYYWKYTEGEVHGLSTIMKLCEGNTSLTGDTKVKYFSHYLDANVTQEIFVYVLDNRLQNNTIYIITRDNLVHGFLTSYATIGGYESSLRLLYCGSVTYNNRVVEAVYGG